MQQERLVESWLLRKQVEAQILANALRGGGEVYEDAGDGDLMAAGFSVEYE